ncbi:MAG: hypothetical protein M5R42_18345 [Rhodocyclaceae bacterium]|nr:hypothetical protein [Rhodocyclaceae bacterium]
METAFKLTRNARPPGAHHRRGRCDRRRRAGARLSPSPRPPRASPLVGPDGHEAGWIERLDALARRAAATGGRGTRPARIHAGDPPHPQRLQLRHAEHGRSTPTAARRACAVGRGIHPPPRQVPACSSRTATAFTSSCATSTNLDTASRKLLDRFL